MVSWVPAEFFSGVGQIRGSGKRKPSPAGSCSERPVGSRDEADDIF